MTEDFVALRLNFLVETVFENALTDRESLYRLIAQKLKWVVSFDRCLLATRDEYGEIQEVVLFEAGRYEIHRSASAPPETLASLTEAITEGVTLSAVSGACSSVAHVMTKVDGEAIGAISFHVEGSVFSLFDVRLIHFISLFVAGALERLEKQAMIERQAARLHEALCESERAHRVKDLFLATLSHELRTPLSVITAWAQILQKQKSPLDADKVMRAIRAIESSGKSLAQLIDDLLDITRIQSGKLNLEKDVLDPATVAQSAIDAVHFSAEQKSIRLDLETEPLGCLISADPARLRQIVVNLLNNAIKFSHSGGRVRVRISRADSAGQSRVRIQVIDGGKGIHPDFLPKIFEYFSQEDGSISRGHGGLGLGLGIVRSLVEMHGGSVEAASDGLGYGAVFTIHLPAVPGARLQRIAEPCAELQLSGSRILVVDDDPGFRDAFSELLGLQSAEVYSVPSVAAALAVLPSFRPDLVFCDLAMPLEDGYSLVKTVKRERAQGAPPIFAVTAHATSDHRELALGCGFSGVLKKPVEPSALLAVLNEFRSVRQ